MPLKQLDVVALSSVSMFRQMPGVSEFVPETELLLSIYGVLVDNYWQSGHGLVTGRLRHRIPLVGDRNVESS